jgi:hypothetical protein
MNACQCGCGEFLPEGSTRQFKRGHKTSPGHPEDGFNEIPTDRVLTIDDAAESTPDDPEPREQENRPRVSHLVTAAMRRDIEGKLALGFGLIGQSWMMIDPLCGKMLIDTGPDMAKAYTPLLCQSPEVVKWLTRSGQWMLWVNAVMATAPLLQMIFAHHLARTIRVERVMSPNGYAPAESEYTVK